MSEINVTILVILLSYFNLKHIIIYFLYKFPGVVMEIQKLY